MLRKVLCAAALAAVVPMLPVQPVHARDAFCTAVKRVMAQRQSNFKRLRGKKDILGTWVATMSLPGMGNCEVDSGFGELDGYAYSCDVRVKTCAEADRAIDRLAQQTFPCLRHVKRVRKIDPDGLTMISFQSRPNYSVVWLSMLTGIDHDFMVTLNILGR